MTLQKRTGFTGHGGAVAAWVQRVLEAAVRVPHDGTGMAREFVVVANRVDLMAQPTQRSADCGPLRMHKNGAPKTMRASKKIP